jgi:hypothetical protein
MKKGRREQFSHLFGEEIGEAIDCGEREMLTEGTSATCFWCSQYTEK